MHYMYVCVTGVGNRTLTIKYIQFDECHIPIIFMKEYSAGVVINHPCIIESTRTAYTHVLGRRSSHFTSSSKSNLVVVKFKQGNNISVTGCAAATLLCVTQIKTYVDVESEHARRVRQT